MSNPTLVCVTSLPKSKHEGAASQSGESAVLIKERSFRAGSTTIGYTRIAAHLVGISAAICRRQARRLRGSARTTESVAGTSGKAADLPETQSGIRKLFDKDEAPAASPEILAKMATAIRGADAVIAGPLSDDDHSMPGLLPHLADLASKAHRAPPSPGALDPAHQFRPGRAEVSVRSDEPSRCSKTCRGRERHRDPGPDVSKAIW